MKLIFKNSIYFWFLIGIVNAASLRTTLDDIQDSTKINFTSDVKAGFSEYDDFSSLVGLDVSYELKERQYLSVYVEYDRVLSRYNDKTRNAGLEDVLITVSNDRFVRFEELNIDFAGRVVFNLPTSQASKNASLNIAYIAKFEIKYDGFGQIVKDMSVSLNTYGYFFDHTYKTANMAGTVYNDKYAIRNELDFHVPLSMRWSIDTYGYIYTSKNSADTVKSSFLYEAGVSYKWSNIIMSRVRFKTKDRIEKNNSLFDDDNSTVKVGIVVKI